MCGFNKTSSYEPQPLWGCQHNWMLVGHPFRIWASTETNSEPPNSIPATQKRQCLNCGGYELIGVQTHNPEICCDERSEESDMSELLWRDIDTAPKDGTWVLVYGKGTDDEYECRKIAVAQYTNDLNRRKGETHWQFAWYDGGYCGRFIDPTHWMPLPDEP